MGYNNRVKPNYWVINNHQELLFVFFFIKQEFFFPTTRTYYNLTITSQNDVSVVFGNLKQFSSNQHIFFEVYSIVSFGFGHYVLIFLLVFYF